MTILPAISPLGVLGFGSLGPLNGAVPSFASSSGISAFATRSTIVEISGVGQLLSAVATFESTLSVLRPGSTDSGLGRNFGTDFGSLAAEAQSFVDAFNTLQRGLDGVSGPFGSLPGSPLAARISEALVERIDADFENPESDLRRLADLGIEFEASPIPGFGGTLSIDLAALRSAFEADAAGSFSLLDSAVRSFGALAGELANGAGNASISASLSSIAQFGFLQQSLTPFDSTLTGTSAATLQGMNNILALASLGQGGVGSRAQLLVAMNEFALVSSLLG
jgi:hypothetical protein